MANFDEIDHPSLLPNSFPITFSINLFYYLIQSFYYLIHFGVEEKKISFSPRQNELGNRSFELGNRIGNRKGNRE